ncbi:MAG TPA: beta-ketoacyl-ACP synthase [Anaeromyxobacteraceae bacterium]|nr:beta-ketoacyl-ACP synthase [Anaeromyxobacteraceae bacterium]
MARAPAPPFPVTAYSVGNAMGATTGEVIRALESGRSGLRTSRADPDIEMVAGEFPGELPPPPASLRAYDTRLVRLALSVLEELVPAIEGAVARYGAGRVAVVLGTSTGGIRESEEAYARWRVEGRLPESFSLVLRHSFNGLLRAVRGRSGAGGPGYVVATACSSSAEALAAGRRLLLAGLADAVLCGGADTLCLTTLRGFRSLEAISRSACRPFAAGRDGLSLGEGAAFLLLERTGEGPAWLLGAGESSDAHHMSHPHPEGLGAKAAMRDALEDAGIASCDVDCVNAHGTGTQANDRIEAAAIGDVLGDRVPVASTKAYTGHLLGAAGATEAVFSIAAIERGFIPESLGASPVDPEIRIAIAREPLRRPVRRALSNSFAFGGANVSLLFGVRP